MARGVVECSGSLAQRGRTDRLHKLTELRTGGEERCEHVLAQCAVGLETLQGWGEATLQYSDPGKEEQALTRDRVAIGKVPRPRGPLSC